MSASLAIVAQAPLSAGARLARNDSDQNGVTGGFKYLLQMDDGCHPYSHPQIP